MRWQEGCVGWIPHWDSLHRVQILTNQLRVCCRSVVQWLSAVCFSLYPESIGNIFLAWLLNDGMWVWNACLQSSPGERDCVILTIRRCVFSTCPWVFRVTLIFRHSALLLQEYNSTCLSRHADLWGSGWENMATTERYRDHIKDTWW